VPEELALLMDFIAAVLLVEQGNVLQQSPLKIQLDFVAALASLDLAALLDLHASCKLSCTSERILNER
jgi:uncharacterized protein involved in type VI secretion and phage assembly